MNVTASKVKKHNMLGEMLLSDGRITQEELEQALSLKKKPWSEDRPGPCGNGLAQRIRSVKASAQTGKDALHQPEHGHC